jgi:hypothetical protein
MPRSVPSQLRKSSSLRDYFCSRETAEVLRLGITSRQTLGHRQGQLIAVLDNNLSVLQKQRPHDGHALMNGRDLVELGKTSSAMLAMLPILTDRSIHWGPIRRSEGQALRLL